MHGVTMKKILISTFMKIHPVGATLFYAGQQKDRQTFGHNEA